MKDLKKEKEKTIIKECQVHGLTKFRLRKSGKSYRCLKCAVDAVKKRRKKVKEQAVAYKGGECERCGYKKCINALEFHHLDPGEKDFAISYKGYCRAWETVKKELDKCIMVCSNCHKEIHFEENLKN